MSFSLYAWWSRLERLGDRLNIRRPKLHTKFWGQAMPQNTTGRSGTFCGTMPRRTRHTVFSLNRKGLRRSATGEHDSIRAPQGTQRLPHASSGKQPVAHVLRRD